MTQQLWKIACGPDCGFLIRSHDKKEVTAAAIAHGKSAHGQTMSAADAKGIMEKAVLPSMKA